MIVYVPGPSTAKHPCEQQWWPHLLGALLREIARTPFGRVCPSRQQSAASVVTLPVLSLPETLLANVFSLAGLPATLNVSLSCRSVHRQLWHSPFFLQALFQASGISDEALRAAGIGDHPPAKALQDFARHWLTGINLLTGSTMQLGRHGAHGPAHALNLEVARRAVLAMRAEDGVTLVQRAAETIADLVLHRAKGKGEVSKAQALLDAVAARSDIFTISQMLAILGAQQKADQDEDFLPIDPKYSVPVQHQNYHG